MIGLSLVFATGVVLVGRNDLGIGIPEVAVTHQRFVVGRDLVPHRTTTHLIAGPKVPRHHLARAPTQRDPNPNFVLFAAHEAPEFI